MNNLTLSSRKRQLPLLKDTMEVYVRQFHGVYKLRGKVATSSFGGKWTPLPRSSYHFPSTPRVPYSSYPKHSSLSSASGLASKSLSTSSARPPKENTPGTDSAKTEQQSQASTPLQILAATIKSHSDALAAYSSSSIPSSPRTPSITQAKHLTALRDAATELSILTTSPEDFVPQLAANNNTFWCLAWLVHFRIPELLPLDNNNNSYPKSPGHAQHDPKPSEDRDIIRGSPVGATPESFLGLDYPTVAAQADVPVHQLQSIARMAMLSGFLSEKRANHTPLIDQQQNGEEAKRKDKSPELDRILCHSPLSAAMTRNPDLLEWMRFVTSTSAPMVSSMIEATERWGRTDPKAESSISSTPGGKEKEARDITQTAYSAAWKTDLPLFAHVASNPDLQARYATYMRIMTTQNEGLAVRHLLEGWRAGWEELERAAHVNGKDANRGGVLVDVGGGLGHVSRAVLKEFPGISTLVVQDRAEVVERAKKEIRDRHQDNGQDSELVKLVFQAHDFFNPQPDLPIFSKQGNDVGAQVPGGGGQIVYLLRQILHDWDDDRAITILRNLANAMEKAGPIKTRLIIMDTILPLPGERNNNEEGGYSRTEEALLRVRDLTMMQAHNAYERTMPEWKSLLAEAHPSLTIRQVVRPFKSLLAVIEVSLS